MSKTSNVSRNRGTFLALESLGHGAISHYPARFVRSGYVSSITVPSGCYR
uniref:Uncharacterized protein n=1 Tax=Anguilla anguilla TaxID=7936 RepID=A0A0E9TGD2_ANGAN